MLFEPSGPEKKPWTTLKYSEQSRLNRTINELKAKVPNCDGIEDGS